MGAFVRAYLQRVVNERDVTAMDTMVRPDYRGSGGDWPADIASLREFYQGQARLRPDCVVDRKIAEIRVISVVDGGTT